MANYQLIVTFDDTDEDWGIDYLEEAISQAGGFVTQTTEVEDDE